MREYLKNLNADDIMIFLAKERELLKTRNELKYPQYYEPRLWPAHILYVQDNPYNRAKLEEKYGKNRMPESIASGQYNVIEFFVDTKNWGSCLDCHWLYRDMPPFTPVEDILALY